MKWIKILAIIAIILYLIFALADMSYGQENEHISRGKMLQSLSKYDNSKAHKNFIKSRRHLNKVGFQPFITVLPQGASLSATAVVSGDRRYVRMGLQPFFSMVGEVTTFNFGRNQSGSSGFNR